MAESEEDSEASTIIFGLQHEDDTKERTIEATELSIQVKEIFSEDTALRNDDVSELKSANVVGNRKEDGDSMTMETVAEDPNDDDDEFAGDGDYMEYGSRQWGDLEGFFNGNFSIQEAIKR